MTNNVCRTCTQTMSKEYFCLDGSIFASANLLVKDVLQICIPEMDVDLLPNSAICKNCMSTISILYQFKTETIKNEQTFRSCTEHIRVKNFKALTKNTVANDTVISTTSDGDKHDGGYELELDDLDQLKTEIVYEEDMESTSVVEISVSDDIESYVEECFDDDLQENIDDHITQEEIKVFQSQPLEELTSDVNLQESNNQSESKAVIKQEPKLDVENFIQMTRDRKIRRNVNRPFKCGQCNFRSDARASLIMHKRIHTGEKPFHCTDCTYQAKRKSHLEDHMKIHTGERPFRCSTCNKSFITKHLLKKHELIHTGEKPYRCVQCNYTARHKLTMTNHVRKVHIGISKKTQASVCYICGKSLAGSTSLSTHMKIHTGVKSHLCELCGRYFREKGMLKNHLQVHTGEKPFTCTECNYMATRKAHLQEHLRTHSNQRELLQCTVCDNRYTTKVLLRKHMKEDHLPSVEETPSIFSGTF